MKRFARLIRLGWLPLLALLAPALGVAQWRVATPAEQALDAEAFRGMDQAIAERFADVQAAVVLLKGRVVYAYHRDGQPDTLHDVQSVAKSALSALVGVALGQGRIAGLDQPVLALMPEWAPLNADPRAAAITLRHLLTMTAGFAVDDPTGTAAPGRPQDAWARSLDSAPGQRFAYDNALVPMLAAVLEKATAMPLADYARRELVAPLAMQEPSYRRGLHLRTEDMARLGQLFLQQGAWNGKALVPESYVLAATRPQNAGGPPVSMPYGYLWWVLPTEAPRRTFMASGYGGQTIWVHPPLELVIATSATASVESQRRGQAVQLLRTRLFAAAQKRFASVER